MYVVMWRDLLRMGFRACEELGVALEEPGVSIRDQSLAQLQNALRGHFAAAAAVEAADRR